MSVQEAPDASTLATLMLFLAVGTFCSGASMRMMDPLLPFFSREFHVSLSDAGQTVTYFSVAYGIALFFIGAVGDRYGKLHVSAWACMICALTTFACALAPDFLFLRIARLLSGAASSAVMTLAMAWVGDVVPYERRQAVLSRLLIGMSLGVAGGILAGGFAADRMISWRLVLTLLAVGYLLVGLALLLLLRTLPSQAGQAHAASGWLLRVSIDEYRRVLQRAWARRMLVIVFVEGVLYFGALAFIPSHLHARYGISLSLSGSVVMLAGLGGLFFSICARRFLGMGERRLTGLGGVLMAASLLTVGLAPGWWFALPGCFFAGLGFYMLHSTLQAQATQMAPERRGAAMAAFSSCFFLGQAAGVALFGRIIEQLDSTTALVTAALGLLAVATIFSNCMKARAAQC